MTEIRVNYQTDFDQRTLEKHDIVFVCIGTDRSTGDALGPLVGTYLEKAGYENVIGTLNDPCHAMNLQERLKEIPKCKTVIAIDSCLGQSTSVGKINFGSGGLRPGAGVSKDLGVVGNFHIAGIVNVGGFMEYFVIQNTRLSFVISMAERIVTEIMSILPLSKLQIASTVEE